MAAARNSFDQALADEGVTGRLADLARSIFQQESSSGADTRTSNVGAVGQMQVMPGTFAGVAEKGWDIKDPVHNARAGIRYLRQMDKLAGGDPALAAAGYYGGPGGLEKARRGVAVSDPNNPKAPTTLQYGAQVAARLPGAAAGTKAKTVVPAVAPAEQAAPVTVVADAGPAPGQAVMAPVAEPAAHSFVASDPWFEFNQAMAAQQQIGPADLSYGAQPAVQAAQIQRPDFMAALGYGGQVQRPDFRAFQAMKSWV